MAGQSPEEVPLLGLEAQNALDAGLQKAGVFCSLCGRPVDEGVAEIREFLIIEVKAPGAGGQPLVVDRGSGPEAVRPTVQMRRIYWCQRESCDASGVEGRAQATRVVPAWTLFAGPDEYPQ